MADETFKPKTVSEVILFVGKKMNPDFNMDDPLRKEIFKKVYYSLTGAPAYSCEGIDPRKGILIYGNNGVGKTDLFRVMQKIFLDTPSQFIRVSAMDLKMQLNYDDGYQYVLEHYGKMSRSDLYIDDIGFAGAEKKMWGNAVNVISELLYLRYELFIQQGFKTHVTSNIVPKSEKAEIEGKRTLRTMYGSTIIDRLQQMTNCIKWKGESLRGGNHGF